jgi:hypothetical protein
LQGGPFAAAWQTRYAKLYPNRYRFHHLQNIFMANIRQCFGIACFFHAANGKKINVVHAHMVKSLLCTNLSSKIQILKAIHCITVLFVEICKGHSPHRNWVPVPVVPDHFDVAPLALSPELQSLVRT